MGAFDPNYEEYKAFGGTLESATFSSLLPKASALVRDLEFPNEATDQTAEAHKRAGLALPFLPLARARHTQAAASRSALQR